MVTYRLTTDSLTGVTNDAIWLDNNSRSLCLPHTFHWIFVIFMEIFKNGSLIYRNGRAANRLYKRYFSATGGRITCMQYQRELIAKLSKLNQLT